ncbi:MAG: hypothetical protein AAFR37_22365, partial [Cyanobacteria bacterium J06628_3]
KLPHVLLPTLGLGGMAAPAFASEGTFTVENAGNSKILRIEAAEVGSNTWGSFAGSAINTGEEITLEWDKSTSDTSCVWKLRAVYSDGPSEPEKFNFCEETAIVFEN